MTRILKYATQPGATLHMPMSREDKIIHVAEQNTGDEQPIKVWAEVTVRRWVPSGAIVPGNDILAEGYQPDRVFRTLATGEEVPDNYVHRGSAVCMNGRYVWHLYEIL